MTLIRDRYKDAPYFLEGISMVTDNLIPVRQHLAEQLPMTYYSLADGLETLIKWGYCLDQPIQELKEPCREMIDAYTRSILPTDNNYDGGGLIYEQLQTLCSLGVLLDCTEALRCLAERLQQTRFQDDLIDFLLSGVVPDRILSGKRQWPDDPACEKLIQISRSDKAAAEGGLQEYLQQFYYTRQNMEDAYDAHKKDGFYYTGYWSFESAAMVKILKLDDSKIIRNPYYPGDMIHGDQPGLGELWKTPSTRVLRQEITADAKTSKSRRWWPF